MLQSYINKNEAIINSNKRYCWVFWWWWCWILCILACIFFNNHISVVIYSKAGVKYSVPEKTLNSKTLFKPQYQAEIIFYLLCAIFTLHSESMHQNNTK